MTGHPPARSAPAAAEPPFGGTVRISVLTPIPTVLRELGVRPGPLLHAAGFELSSFDDPDLEISYRAGGRLLAHCAAATGCDHFGLLLGARGEAALLGLPGFLALSASDVGSALDDLVRNLDLHDTGGVTYVETAGDRCLLGFAVVDSANPAAALIHDLSIAFACRLMRSLCGPRWEPAEVFLPRRRPPDPAPWTQYFRAPVRFGSPQTAVAFPSRWLRAAVPSANPHLHRHFEREAGRRRRQPALTFAEAVRRVLNAAIAHGDCTAPRVAGLLGIHARTLNRRLGAEGAAFKALRDEIRFEKSRELLRQTRMTLGEIAAALGYAEGSVFLRAFVRWTGCTPQQWRERQSAAARPPLARGSSRI